MKIAIVVGLNEEKKAISRALNLSTTFKFNKLTFPVVKGKFAGNEIILVGCGPGKVNSSIATFDVIKNCQPDIVISCGLAGASAKNLKLGDIVIAEKVIQYDVVAYVKENPMPRLLRVYKNKKWFKVSYLNCNKKFLNHCKKIFFYNDFEKACFGILATGDQLILSKDRRNLISKLYKACAIDMESAAIAHICHMFDIKFGAIRIISDTEEITTVGNVAPSLIRDKKKDVRIYSGICAEVTKEALLDLHSI